MNTDTTFIKQAEAKIRQWKQELIELEARVEQGVEDPSQAQICAQRIIELKSQIESTESQIKHIANV
jgi:small-conductance mechanosensitive channel